MTITPVFLMTDILFFVLLIGLVGLIFYSRSKPHLRMAWRQVFHKPLGLITVMILSLYLVVSVLDSMHFKLTMPHDQQRTQYQSDLKSVLDVVLEPIGSRYEKTYSAPFALHLYAKESIETATGVERIYPHLRYSGVGIKNLQARNQDIVKRIGIALLGSIFITLLIGGGLIFLSAYRSQQSFKFRLKQMAQNKTDFPWRAGLITAFILLACLLILAHLAQAYHILGTDKIGRDVFYETIKSIRTGLLIGTLTTLIMLPFALLLGIAAGFFGGVLDDLIQYVYVTLSSIPGVLLIAATILSLQVYMSNHPQSFATLAQRADARLLVLCVILGVTSWTSLCRLLRGETLKLREMDYVSAAKVLGVQRWKILLRHILPNVMHIVLIAVVLDFSTLVLAEAVLSYVGVGVDPTSFSWGNMINSARLELAREPIVWWPLLAAFIFMFILVLSANLFSDKVRDAFDPRVKT